MWIPGTINSFSQKGSKHLKINGGAEVKNGTFNQINIYLFF